MFDGILKPFLLDAVIGRKPSTRPSKLSVTLVRTLGWPSQTCAYDALLVCWPLPYGESDRTTGGLDIEGKRKPQVLWKMFGYSTEVASF
jgi:hypothetical protein